MTTVEAFDILGDSLISIKNEYARLKEEQCEFSLTEIHDIAEKCDILTQSLQLALSFMSGRYVLSGTLTKERAILTLMEFKEKNAKYILASKALAKDTQLLKKECAALSIAINYLYTIPAINEED